MEKPGKPRDLLLAIYLPKEKRADASVLTYEAPFAAKQKFLIYGGRLRNPSPYGGFGAISTTLELLVLDEDGKATVENLGALKELTTEPVAVMQRDERVLIKARNEALKIDHSLLSLRQTLTLETGVEGCKITDFKRADASASKSSIGKFYSYEVFVPFSANEPNEKDPVSVVALSDKCGEARFEIKLTE